MVRIKDGLLVFVSLRVELTENDMSSDVGLERLQRY